MDGKTCKRGSEVAPIVLARFSMYKNQVRVAEEREKEKEKEKEASDRGKASIEKEKVAKQREEKARVRERIVKEKLQKYKFALLCHRGFLLLFMCW